jgi:site-specific recombinase XerD
MTATTNGIDSGKPQTHRSKFDLFRPVSVKPDGRRLTSANWCVRFQHKGKRTCRSLGTADYRLAEQRARKLVNSVRQQGWSGAVVLPTSRESMTIEMLIEKYQSSAVTRGLRPRSISSARKALRQIARGMGARRVGDLTPAALQAWARECGLKPANLRSVLKNAGSIFAAVSLQAMDMTDTPNPFLKVVRPKLDREPFLAPTRQWIVNLMQLGVKELAGEVRPAFVLALGCGLRWGEIASLTWDNVLPDGVRVLASLAKGRRSRIVPMGATVKEVLEAARAEGKILPHRPDIVHDDLSSWLRNQGVQAPMPVHYLRKCFGSLAVADHGIFIGSKLLGHASIAITSSTYAGQVDQLPAVKF